ncbi:MAG: hypothetical protein HY360_19400 [Verrucomicrobia bacterium]|nr:hypothetical protein [Verrucomicrobiota bacterium]
MEKHDDYDEDDPLSDHCWCASDAGITGGERRREIRCAGQERAGKGQAATGAQTEAATSAQTAAQTRAQTATETGAETAAAAAAQTAAETQSKTATQTETAAGARTAGQDSASPPTEKRAGKGNI